MTALAPMVVDWLAKASEETLQERLAHYEAQRQEAFSPRDNEYRTVLIRALRAEIAQRKEEPDA